MMNHDWIEWVGHVLNVNQNHQAWICTRCKSVTVTSCKPSVEHSDYVVVLNKNSSPIITNTPCFGKYKLNCDECVAYGVMDS